MSRSGKTQLYVGLGLALSVFGLSGEAQGQGLNVDAWLQRPGVKLLAVEFYATWCKPCMAAVPRWKKLHDKYRSEGLRFVVVATQDADGACANPGWAPDDVICDDEGRLAKRFGATSLPAAYLWSWNGELLAKQVHVDDIESKIVEWMKKTPRVDVDVGSIATGAGVNKNELKSLVRGELLRTDKLVVVATAAERKALRAIVKASLRQTADSALACQVGAEISANSLLTAVITGRRERLRLQLKLLSAERGCLIASASTDWRIRNPPASVGEAVAELIGRFRKSPTQLPWRTQTPPAQTKTPPIATRQPPPAPAEPMKSRVTDTYKITYPAAWTLDTSGRYNTDFLLFMNSGSEFRENVNLIIGNFDGGIDELAAAERRDVRTDSNDAVVLESRVDRSGPYPYFEMLWTGIYGRRLKFKYRAYLWKGKRYGFTYTARPGPPSQYAAKVDRAFDTIEFR